MPTSMQFLSAKIKKKQKLVNEISFQQRASKPLHILKRISVKIYSNHSVISKYATLKSKELCT
jgi:hypothetical protein